MSGSAVELEQLLRQLGPDPLIRELEPHGYSPTEKRARCPFPGCADKGDKARRNLQLYPSGKPHVFCFSCGAHGDLLDLLEATRRYTKAEAIAHVRGAPAPARPPLRVVSSAPAAVDDPDKLKPEEVKRLWESLARSDPEAERYLETRRLEEAVDLGLVRFANQANADRRISGHAKRGHRIAVLLTDVVGNLRGIQMRLARKPKGDDEPKLMSVKGSDPGRGFFGTPELVEASPIVCVAEGLADTLAVACWTAGRRGYAIVGASGIGNLPKVARQLEEAGIDIEGKRFLLFTQNDRPRNKSRAAFERLRQLLVQRGARAQHVRLDEDIKDVALRLERQPDLEWPPEDVAKFLAPEPEPGAEVESAEVVPEGHAFPQAREYRVDVFRQNLSTLLHLLDDPTYREPMIGRGDWQWCQMRLTPLYAGKPVHDADVTALRAKLEQHTTPGGKPLMFSKSEVWDALIQLSMRKQVHPAREHLLSLTWDGKERLGTELPALFGYGPEAFQSTLIRRWFIAAAARALHPGCKQEDVLVLVGAQGASKTNFFHVIGGEFFSSEPILFGDKDSKLLMRRNWLIEWGEMESLKRAKDVEQVKGFLSRQVEQYRPHYGRSVYDVPRACIFGGTTNNENYLADPTGNRRFWTVKLLRDFDISWVERTREQLLAEAVALFRAATSCPDCVPLMPLRRCVAHRWWLDRPEIEKLQRINEGHEMAGHPWTDLVRDWLEKKMKEIEKEIAEEHFGDERVRQVNLRSYVTGGQVLVEALNTPPHQLTRAASMQVAQIMSELGWPKNRRKLEDGKHHWVYVRPGVEWSGGEHVKDPTSAERLYP